MGFKPETEVFNPAIAADGHIYVGKEDNVVYKKGVLAENNMHLIARIHRGIEEFGCEADTPDETRQLA